MALCAAGNAPNITAFHFRDSVVLVSGQCGVPQWPGSTRLSSSFGQQRGHVTPPVTALKLRFMSPSACAPFGWRQQALCKVAFARCSRTAVGASRSLAHLKHGCLRAPCACLHLSTGQALCAVQLVSGSRPVIWFVTPPTQGPRCCAVWLRPELRLCPPQAGALSQHVNQGEKSGSDAPPKDLVRLKADPGTTALEQASHRSGIFMRPGFWEM